MPTALRRLLPSADSLRLGPVALLPFVPPCAAALISRNPLTQLSIGILTSCRLITSFSFSSIALHPMTAPRRQPPLGEPLIGNLPLDEPLPSTGVCGPCAGPEADIGHRWRPLLDICCSPCSHAAPLGSRETPVRRRAGLFLDCHEDRLRFAGQGGTRRSFLLLFWAYFGGHNNIRGRAACLLAGGRSWPRCPQTVVSRRRRGKGGG